MDNTLVNENELFIPHNVELVGSFDAKIPPHTCKLVQPLMIPHDYRNIEIADGTTITLDMEELKEQMKRDFYKQDGLTIQFGA